MKPTFKFAGVVMFMRTGSITSILKSVLLVTIVHLSAEALVAEHSYRTIDTSRAIQLPILRQWDKTGEVFLEIGYVKNLAGITGKNVAIVPYGGTTHSFNTTPQLDLTKEETVKWSKNPGPPVTMFNYDGVGELECVSSHVGYKRIFGTSDGGRTFTLKDSIRGFDGGARSTTSLIDLDGDGNKDLVTKAMSPNYFMGISGDYTITPSTKRVFTLPSPFALKYYDASDGAQIYRAADGRLKTLVAGQVKDGMVGVYLIDITFNPNSEGQTTSYKIVDSIETNYSVEDNNPHTMLFVNDTTTKRQYAVVIWPEVEHGQHTTVVYEISGDRIRESYALNGAPITNAAAKVLVGYDESEPVIVYRNGLGSYYIARVSSLDAPFAKLPIAHDGVNNLILIDDQNGDGIRDLLSSHGNVKVYAMPAGSANVGSGVDVVKVRIVGTRIIFDESLVGQILIDIVDALGKRIPIPIGSPSEVYQGQAIDLTAQLNNLPSGRYFINVRVGSRITTLNYSK